ncbi:MAG: Sporulation initiation inhibitor protein Soj [Candidatus Methanoperedenaceae archaeon GB50]|nr:MAG: Sporulation initiation inhibitor protein Soj [Candidatus Methanoperedenaceae archaeon GB50]
MAALRSVYDFIFLDCPPSLGIITINALTAADTVLIPVQCEYYALEGLTQLLKTIKLIKQRVNSTLRIEGFLLTMFDKRNILSQQIETEVRKHFKEYTFKTVISRNVRLGEAPSHGLPVFFLRQKMPRGRAVFPISSRVFSTG